MKGISITLCTPTFSLSLPSPFYQGSTLTLPIPLPILIVLVLDSPLTSHPSQIAGTREELWIKKTQTLTTRTLSIYVTGFPYGRTKSNLLPHKCPESLFLAPKCFGLLKYFQGNRFHWHIENSDMLHWQPSCIDFHMHWGLTFQIWTYTSIWTIEHQEHLVSKAKVNSLLL